MFRLILKSSCFTLSLLLGLAGQICLAQSVTLDGRVKTETGSPPANGKVVLIGKNIRTETDIDRRTGKFSFKRVPQGTFKLTACAGTSYIPIVEENIVVKDGRAPWLELTLVFAADRKPMRGQFKNGKGLLLAALGHECRVATTNVNDREYYQFKELPRPPREYKIAVVNKDGRLVASVVVPLPEQETEVALSLNVDKNNVAVGLSADLAQPITIPKSLLAGRVKDPSGAVAPGVEVRATNRETGLAFTTKTNDEGEYSLELLAGNYDLEIEGVGFKSDKRENVLIAATQALDFTMEVGGIGSTVSVATEPPAIDVTQTRVVTTLSERTLQDLPLDGRNFYELALVVGTTQRERDVGSGESGVSINGQRPNSANILIDGIEANSVDNSLGNILGQNGPELPYGTIVVHNTSTHETAESSSGSGGTIEAETNHGTNEVRGTAFYWNSSSALGARDFFEIRKSHSLSHQFGFTIGGPVIENRLHYFGGYEGRREVQARPQLASVPSPARLSQARLVLLNSGLTENALSTRLLDFFPTPDRPGVFNNRTVNSPALHDLDNLLLRIDPTIDHRNSATVTYNFVRTNQLFPFGLSFLPGYRIHFSGASHALSGTSHISFTPRTLNQIWIRYDRINNALLPEDHNFDPLSIGLNTGVTDPQRFGLPFIKIVGFDVIGSPTEIPNQELSTTWHIKEMGTVIRGKNTLRFGVDIRRTTINIRNDAATRGRIVFDGSVLGDPLADFLAGFPAGNTGILQGDTQRRLARTWLSGFAQDEIRIKSNLTFNLGLRYSLNGAPKEKQNRLSNFLPEAGGLVRVGSPQLPKLHDKDLNNLGPRIGVAWSPGRSEDLVIRANWGIFFDSPSLRLFTGLCPCPNSLSSGVTMNPIGPDSAFAQKPLQPVPFGIDVPIFQDSRLVDISSVQKNFKNPRIQNSYLGFEYSPVSELVLEIGYSGSIGNHLYRLVDINQPRPGDVGTMDSRRPFFQNFPEFGSINQLTSSGHSTYHALRTSVRWRRSNKLWLQGGYAFSKALDDASRASEVPQDSRNLRAERFFSRFDQRHRFTLSWHYELGTSKNEFLNGWHLSGVVSAESGNPFTPLVSFDNSGTATFMDRPTLTNNPRINLSRTQLYSSTAFTIPEGGTFGNVPRNALVGPTLNFLDLAVIKRTAISDTRKIEFRAEIYNLLNHANFRLPNNLVDEPSFGSVTATDPDHGRRKIKLGIRLVF